MLKTILKLLLDPYPVRTITITMMRRLRLGSYPWRARIGAVPRPAYGYCVHHAAVLARELGYHRISVLELGVGDGSGGGVPDGVGPTAPGPDDVPLQATPNARTKPMIVATCAELLRRGCMLMRPAEGMPQSRISGRGYQTRD